MVSLLLVKPSNREVS